MILQWHPEMDVIVDAAQHRRREQDERKQEAREFLADREVRWPGPGRWPSGCGKHQMLAPDCRDCVNLLVLSGGNVPPPPDPAEEIRAVLSEPLGLDAGALISRFPDWPAGTCRECHTGPLHKPGIPLCWACGTLAGMRAANQVPAPAQDVRAQNRRTAACMLAIMAAFTLLILSVKLAVPWLELASVAPFIAGVKGMRK